MEHSSNPHRCHATSVRHDHRPTTECEREGRVKLEELHRRTKPRLPGDVYIIRLFERAEAKSSAVIRAENP